MADNEKKIEVAFDKFVNDLDFALLMEAGTGKTKVVLDTATYLWEQQKIDTLALDIAAELLATVHTVNSTISLGKSANVLSMDGKVVIQLTTLKKNAVRKENRSRI